MIKSARDSMKLRDKVAVVTGSSRGIGRAIALAFAKEGAHVVVNYYKNEEKAREVVKKIEEIGRRALSIRADVSDYKQVEEMADRVISEFGRVDILVNNAGILIKSPLEETSPRDWERVVSVNLNGVFFTMRAFGKRMLSGKGGSIINIASVAGYVPLVDAGAYSATKAAVIMLTKQAAVEWGPRGVRVNAICPGPVLTDLLLSEYTPKELEVRKKVTPATRLGDPEDIARLAVFLASDESRYITGEAYGIDGGLASSTYWILHKLLKKLSEETGYYEST